MTKAIPAVTLFAGLVLLATQVNVWLRADPPLSRRRLPTAPGWET